MTRIKFEEILRKSGSSEKFEMNAAHLAQALGMIQERKRRRRAIFWWSGAGLLLVGALLFSGLLFNSSSKIEQASNINYTSEDLVNPTSILSQNDEEKIALSPDETAPVNKKSITKDKIITENLLDENANLIVSENESLKAATSTVDHKGKSKFAKGFFQESNQLGENNINSQSSFPEQDLKNKIIVDNTIIPQTDEFGGTSRPQSSSGQQLLNNKIHKETEPLQVLKILPLEEEAMLQPSSVPVRAVLPGLNWGMVFQIGGYGLKNNLPTTANLAISITQRFNNRWFVKAEFGMEYSTRFENNYLLKRVDSYGVEVVSKYYVVQPQSIWSTKANLMMGRNLGRWNVEIGPHVRALPIALGSIEEAQFENGQVTSSVRIAEGKISNQHSANLIFGGEARLTYRFNAKQDIGLGLFYQRDQFFNSDDVRGRQDLDAADIRLHYNYRF